MPFHLLTVLITFPCYFTPSPVMPFHGVPFSTVFVVENMTAASTFVLSKRHANCRETRRNSNPIMGWTKYEL
jgi:hypothetical protein